MYTQQQIRDSYKKSPRVIREIIVDQEYMLCLEKIAKDNGLDDKQLSSLEQVTSGVLLGLSEKKKLPEDLRGAGFGDNKIKKIADDLVIKIIDNIKDIYKTINKRTEAEYLANGWGNYIVEEENIDVNSSKKAETPIQNQEKNKDEETTKESQITQWSQKVFKEYSDLNQANKQGISKTVKKLIETKKEVGYKKLEGVPENIDSLPESIQKVIFDGVWKEKVGEISKKYSLDGVQNDNLVDIVMFMIIGLEDGKNIVDVLTQKINISRLLAEQIVEDLNSRVFKYALEKIRESDEVKTPPSKPAEQKVETLEKKVVPTIETKLAEINEKVPEIRPDISPVKESATIFPMIEENEKVKINPFPKEEKANTFVEQKDISETKPEKSTLEQIQEKNGGIKKNESELVQSPIPVPRFTALSSEEDEKIDTQPTIENPNNEIPETKADNQNIKTETVDKAPPAPIKYSADPYREPLG